MLIGFLSVALDAVVRIVIFELATADPQGLM